MDQKSLFPASIQAITTAAAKGRTEELRAALRTKLGHTHGLGTQHLKDIALSTKQLHLAIENSHYAVVKLLLRRERYTALIPLWPRDGYWMTALHVAVANDDIRMVRLLLRNGVRGDYVYRCLFE
jgi:hypothetical protein